MVDFRKMISYDGRQRVSRMLCAVDAFSNLDKKGQARVILEVARKVYDRGSFNTSHHYSYDEALLLRVIPQIAKRLDPDVALLDREQPGEDGPHRTPWAEKTDEEIAHYARSCVANSNLSRAGGGENYESASSLVMNWNRGNLVKIATNTLLPGSFDLVIKNEEETRAPLDGYQVVHDGEHGVSILRYEETTQAASDWIRTGLEKIRAQPEWGHEGYGNLREIVLSGEDGNIEVRKWDDNELIESIPLREPEVEESPAP